MSWEMNLNSYDIEVEEALYPTLVLEPTIESDNVNKTREVERVSGSAYLKSGDNNNRYIGDIRPRHSINSQLRRNDSKFDPRLRLEISPQKLKLIEELRNGSDLEVYFEINVSTVQKNGNNQGERHKGSVHETFKVPKSRWIELLDNSGFTELRMFEIPTQTELKEVEELQTAYDDLEQAFEKYRNMLDPISECREVLEALSQVIDQTNMDEKPKERMEKILYRTEKYLDLGSHSDDKIPESRMQGSDWLFALRITASAYERVAKELT